jgi:hypothetical protein
MPEPQRFRGKTIDIDALYFDGTNHADIKAFTGGGFEAVAPADRGDDPDAVAQLFSQRYGRWLPVKAHVWIARDPYGSSFPLETKLLNDAYEPVKPPAQVHTAVIDLHGKRNHPDYDPALNEEVVYVGRRQWWGADRVLDGHPLHNPFAVKRYGLHESLTRYADWLLGDTERVAIARSLCGLVLACWCVDTLPACHGLAIAAVADDDRGRIAMVLERARGGAR